jgi:hypothetical protein
MNIAVIYVMHNKVVRSLLLSRKCILYSIMCGEFITCLRCSEIEGYIAACRLGIGCSVAVYRITSIFRAKGVLDLGTSWL